MIKPELYRRLYLLILDDNIGSPGLLSEWGWSVYIEADGLKALFDADTSPRVIEYNSSKLSVDLKDIEWAFLSHHHRDHSGGFEYIAVVKPGLTIYVPPGDTGYLERLGLKPIVVKEPLEIRKDVWSTGSYGAHYKASTLWEHGLVIKTSQGPILIVGCSHPGVDYMAEKAVKIVGEELYLVIGGFHGPSPEEIDRLAKLAQYIAPAHCSGDEAREYTKKKYPEKYVEVRTGSNILVSDEGLQVTD